MDLMINQLQPDIHEKMKLFQSWVIPINILQQHCNDDYDNGVLLNAQALTDLTVETKSNIVDGILADNINNRGIIPQVKVQSGAVVNGGKLTKYINNKRILSK